jgi:hypothetical protein
VREAIGGATERKGEKEAIRNAGRQGDLRSVDSIDSKKQPL